MSDTQEVLAITGDPTEEEALQSVKLTLKETCYECGVDVWVSQTAWFSVMATEKPVVVLCKEHFTAHLEAGDSIGPMTIDHSSLSQMDGWEEDPADVYSRFFAFMARRDIREVAFDQNMFDDKVAVKAFIDYLVNFWSEMPVTDEQMDDLAAESRVWVLIKWTRITMKSLPEHLNGLTRVESLSPLACVQLKAMAALKEIGKALS